MPWGEVRIKERDSEEWKILIQQICKKSVNATEEDRKHRMGI